MGWVSGRQSSPGRTLGKSQKVPRQGQTECLARDLPRVLCVDFVCTHVSGCMGIHVWLWRPEDALGVQRQSPHFLFLFGFGDRVTGWPGFTM